MKCSCLCEKIDNKWIYVEEKLYDELSLMLELELKHIRFIIQPEEDNGESSSRNQV
ncbi:12270_t:CDS:1, partial [Rhizophagus irregularis]